LVLKKQKTLFLKKLNGLIGLLILETMLSIKIMYLNSLKQPFEDESTPLLHADTAAVYYFLVEE
jgi:hypothetical protein